MKAFLHFFKLYKCNMLIKYYDQEFLIYNELDLKNVFKKILIFSNKCPDVDSNFILIHI